MKKKKKIEKLCNTIENECFDLCILRKITIQEYTGSLLQKLPIDRLSITLIIYITRKSKYIIHIKSSYSNKQKQMLHFPGEIFEMTVARKEYYLYTCVINNCVILVCNCCICNCLNYLKDTAVLVEANINFCQNESIFFILTII